MEKRNGVAPALQERWSRSLVSSGTLEWQCRWRIHKHGDSRGRCRAGCKHGQSEPALRALAVLICWVTRCPPQFATLRKVGAEPAGGETLVAAVCTLAEKRTVHQHSI